MNQETEEQEPWDFWDFVGMNCAGYNSKIDADLINVFIGTTHPERFNTTLATALELSPDYVELLQCALCSADFCDYGTSPRGCWPIGHEEGFASNIAKLNEWYLRRWGDPHEPALPAWPGDAS